MSAWTGTSALLEVPLLPLPPRLAVSNILPMLAQSSTGLMETHFIGLVVAESILLGGWTDRRQGGQNRGHAGAV